jgi:hypothetical protein
MSDEREYLRSGLQRTKDCPSLEELERVLNGADPAAVAHVQSCPFCSSELQMLRSFTMADVPPEDASAVRQITERLARRPIVVPMAETRLPWWRMGGWWMRPVLAFAAMLVVAGIGLQFFHTGPPPLRTDTGGDVYRSRGVTVLSPSGDLTEAPKEVRWEAVPAAARYRVRLLEVDGNELWVGESSQASMALPDDVRARIVPAKTLSLVITALDAAGRNVAESANVRFRVLQSLYPR